MWILVWRLWKATFLICCVPVNSCSITSMTVVHFLHQTDIGLALRKHKAIYSISPTLFSPSLSLPLYLSPSHVFAFLLCKQESGVKCVSCTGLTCPFSFSSLHLSQNFSSSFPRSTWLCSPPSHCSFPPLSHLHPHPLPLPLPRHPLSLSPCLCFPLLNCFAVDLTAMINDLKASGKQTERDTTSLPFPYKPPFLSYVNCSYVHTGHVMTFGKKIYIIVRLHEIKILYTYIFVWFLQTTPATWQTEQLSHTITVKPHTLFIHS